MTTIIKSSWAAKHQNMLSPLADKDVVPVAVDLKAKDLLRPIKAFQNQNNASENIGS